MWAIQDVVGPRAKPGALLIRWPASVAKVLQSVSFQDFVSSVFLYMFGFVIVFLLFLSSVDAKR